MPFRLRRDDAHFGDLLADLARAGRRRGTACSPSCWGVRQRAARRAPGGARRRPRGRRGADRRAARALERVRHPLRPRRRLPGGLGAAERAHRICAAAEDVIEFELDELPAAWSPISCSCSPAPRRSARDAVPRLQHPALLTDSSVELKRLGRQAREAQRQFVVRRLDKGPSRACSSAGSRSRSRCAGRWSRSRTWRTRCRRSPSRRAERVVALLVLAVVGRRGLRLDERRPRRRQRDRHLALDGRADPPVRAWRMAVGAQLPGRAAWASTSRSPSALASSPSRPGRTASALVARGTGRRHRLERPHLVAGPAVVVDAGPDRRAGRRRARRRGRGRRGGVVGRSSSRRCSRRCIGLVAGVARRRRAGHRRAHRQPPADLRRLRIAQSVSAGAVALAHGLQDGQKTMGAIVLALVAAGRLADGTLCPTGCGCSPRPRSPWGPRPGAGG